MIPAEALRVETGVMDGEPLGRPEDAVAGDVYALRRGAEAAELLVAGGAVAAGSSVGREGGRVETVARHRLMGERGAMAEVVVLSVDGAAWLLPLGSLAPAEEYTLLASRPAEGVEPEAVASVSFARGTRITMAGGRMVPVEAIRPGDRVLTRDHGPQPVRWVGHQPVVAEGSAAPVVLAPGAMNNDGELVLSPDHRLYVWQRTDLVGAGGAEVLVRARHLVGGAGIARRDMPRLDLCHLLLDAHEIIYAEGIPAESLLVAPEVLAGLDDDLAERVGAQGVTHVPRDGWDPAASDLLGLDAAETLRRASEGRGRDRGGRGGHGRGRGEG